MLLPVLLYGLFRALDGLRARSRFACLLVATLVLLTGALLELWTVGYEGRSAVVGGVVPWCDSHDYTSDALRLVHGEPLALSSKRPLFPIVLAGLLTLTGERLRVVLVLFMLAGAGAAVLVTDAIWRGRGRSAAFLVYLLLYVFERRWTGLVQTEHLAMPLGCVAFLLFWRAAGGRAGRGSVLVALFVLSFALLARPGPFFVLPAIALFFALQRPRGGRLRAFASAVGVVVVAFVVNQWLGSALGTGTTMSDYPAIAYGMLHDRDAQFLCIDRPEVCARPPGEATRAAWRLVANDVSAHPLVLVEVLGGSLTAYFASSQGLFSLVWYDPDDLAFERGDPVGAARGLGAYGTINMLSMGIAAVAFTLSVPLAMTRTCREGWRGDRTARLLLAANVGFVASAPFLAPAITPSLQTFAAVLPWLGALPALAFAGIHVTATTKPLPTSGWLAGGTLASCVACILALLLGRRSTPRPSCSNDDRLVDVVPGTVVRLRTGHGWSIDSVSIEDLERGFAFLEKHNGQVVRSVRALERPGGEVAYAYDVCTRRAVMLMDPEGRLANRRWLDVEVGATEDPEILRVLAVSSLPTGGSPP